ncbi:MAG: T9SS type A sorting domain-containing protein [Chitinophagaceae bacterium]|nr:T9SS type A sorting domain-containing protein [Chitinophagaceae bacterium]
MTNHLPPSVIGKRILLTVFVLAMAFEGMSQRWTNAVRIGLGAGAETGRGVCTDASGNVYYMGIFSGANTDFDPGPGSTLLSPLGLMDVFVTKYAADGTFLWAVRGGGISQDQAAGIALDATGIYITGTFNVSASFGAINLSSTGGAGTDIYVAKLDFNGNYLWAKNFGASGIGGDNGQSICTDGAGGVYFSGTIGGNANIGGFSLSTTGGSGGDMVVAKLSATDGSVTWAVNGGSSASSDNGTGSSICYHPGLNEVIVGGAYFSTTATYGSFNLTNSGGNDLVLLEVNASTGAFLQAFGFGGDNGGDEDVAGVCYDPPTQDVFLTGFYHGNIIFPGHPALSNAGAGDLYIARYSPSSNNFSWAVSAGSTGEDKGYGICSNGAGQVYLAGYYGGAMSFGSTNLAAPATMPDVLTGGVATADGTKLWALTASGNDPLFTNQARAISTGGPLKKIAVTGQFGGTGTFGSFSFASAGNVDIFLAQMAGGIVASTSTTDPSCDNGCDGTATVTASGGVAPLSYSWSPSGGNSATATSLCAGNYTVTVTDAIGQNINAAAVISLPASTIATEEASNPAVNISPSNTVIANAACRLIAKVVPNGAHPINGATAAFVKFAATVPTYPPVTGKPFVQRLVQITPATGAATATGRVTLYYKQSEFDAYNAYPGVVLKLPMNSGDAAGKANLRIEKYPGTSSDGSGLPGTYTGASQLIDPNDGDIIYNAVDSRWEVSFDVIGFSGFITHTSSIPLPVDWLSVTAFLDAQQRAQLNWEVQESNVQDYKVERSADGATFNTVATLASQGDGEHRYSYNEPTALTGKVYYRIRQNDKDGRSSYSQILTLNSQQGGTVTVYPNPTGGMMNLNITDRSLLNTVARLYSSDGRELQQISIRQTVTQISLNNYGKGTYFLRLSNGETLRLIRK